MISTLKFFNTFGRNVNTIQIRKPHSGMLKAYTVASISRTYHFYRKNALEKKNINLSLQTSSTVRFLGSAVNQTNGSELVVNHNCKEQVFCVDVEAVGSGYLEYQRKGELIILKHTFVPKALGGRGVGKILAKVALDYVAKNDLKLEIQCSFVREYVSRYEPKYIKYMQK